MFLEVGVALVLSFPALLFLLFSMGIYLNKPGVPARGLNIIIASIPFLVTVGAVYVWFASGETSYGRALLADKVKFENMLISLCPNCPIEFETGQREGRSRLQTCTLTSCLAQARLLANALASKYMLTFSTEFDRFGNILVGWRGNGRADGAPWHGMSGADHDKGFGLKCAGWMDLTSDEFFKAIRPFSQQGSQCFRAARVGKPEDRDSIFNHSWVLVYGPKRGQLTPSMYKKGDFDIAIDPWPVGGKTIMNPYPYEAKRLDAPLLW